MSGYSRTELNLGMADIYSWMPINGRWYVSNFPTDLPPHGYFAVVDDFGNLTEVDT